MKTNNGIGQISATVGETILEQLGGTGRLSVMIGAKHFMDLGDGVQFKFAAKATNKANCVVIRLDPDDTYRITFWAIRGVNCRELETVEMAYADSLRSLIESRTGLYLSLGTMGR